MSGIVHLPEDGVNRYRIMHPDKDLRPLAKRLNRYAAASASTAGSPEDQDLENDREMIRLEAMKWKMQVERMMGSASTLDRQRETYINRAEQTVSKTESLRQTLEEEKALLETRRRERDRMIKCDEVAAKVTARGKNRQELDERISTLQQTLAEHKAALGLYQETAEGRVSIFNQITDLVKNCRDLKLPIDPNATIPVEDENDKTETDDVGSSNTLTFTAGSSSNSTIPNPKLSSMALPFQPSGSSGAGSASASGSRGPQSSAPNISRGAKSRSATPPASASLPARPPSGPSAGSSSRVPSAPLSNANRSNANLPARPSQLRSSTTSHLGGGSLEEGELGGDEDGEVKERGIKRAMEPERASRSTRSRK